MNNKQLALIAALTGQCLFLVATPAHAACTPEQYIAHGRAGLNDLQIKEKCKTAYPAWLAGQWHVTLKMNNYKVHDPANKESTGFNPFMQGMKTMTDIVGKPDEQREEIWLLALKADVLGLSRIYNPKHNPGSAPFAHVSGKQPSGHRIGTSKISKNHLMTTMVSPPYGNEGIESWQFDIDLTGNIGQQSQLLGRYKVNRKSLLDGKIYSHDGIIIMTKAPATPR